MNGLIIYSGGMDSTTLLWSHRLVIKMAVSFDYGSKHNDREWEMAKRNTKKLSVPHVRIPLDFEKWGFKSKLLKNQGEVPHGHYAEENMKDTVVPFRNGIMLSIAAGIAESEGLDIVLIANHFGDHAIYPDCREDFILPMNAAMMAGTYNKVHIKSPFLKRTKREIALKGKSFGVPFEDTWSCYEGGEIHCGKCGTCVERIEALKGFDPTEYKDTTFAEKVLNEFKER